MTSGYSVVWSAQPAASRCPECEKASEEQPMGVGYWVVRWEVGIWQAWPGSRMLGEVKADVVRPVKPEKL